MNLKRLGRSGERVAERYLAESGYSILARNWRAPEGEIDLIAQQGETLVFVEVKTRASLDFGFPEESITRAKRCRLQKLAWAYLDAVGKLEADWRIDVIAIEGEPRRGVSRLDHFRNAIEFELDL